MGTLNRNTLKAMVGATLVASANLAPPFMQDAPRKRWTNDRPRRTARKTQSKTVRWSYKTTLHRQHGERECARRVRQRGDGMFAATLISTGEPCVLEFENGTMRPWFRDSRPLIEYPPGSFFVLQSLSDRTAHARDIFQAGKGRRSHV